VCVRVVEFPKIALQVFTCEHSKDVLLDLTEAALTCSSPVLVA
jgi:hypothetical protein